MSEILPPIMFQLGVGGIGGFIVGYTIKKLLRIIAVVFGLFLLALLYLSSINIIDVDFNKLNDFVFRTLPIVNNIPLLAPIISNLPFAGSFTLGLAYGIKKA